MSMVNNSSSNIVSGALVRTIKVHKNGICKAPVEGTKQVNNETWAYGKGWEFPSKELEVIRSPII